MCRAAVGLAVASFGNGAMAAPASSSDLADLSIEELANVEITSVSRRPERLSDAAASIYVITSDDIRRSGVTTLPEALRLAPNLQVARIDASQYAISARGFNNAIGNKLLVLVDGRTIYTPLFSGVFWDQQDVMLEDVERIEVISGPGATLWGANAVNGVINVTTKSARDTQGGMVVAGAGNRERDAAFRYGGAAGEEGAYRVYGKASGTQSTSLASGAGVTDGREFFQTGFRSDWKSGGGRVTVQGDAYNGRTDQRAAFGPFALGRVEVSGFNLLGRWSRSDADGSGLSVQSYIDHSERKDALLYQPSADIFDVEFQHGFGAGRHRILWGGGYRYSHDDVRPGVFFSFVPPSTDLAWYNLFLQDEIKLADRLVFTPGIKFEHNDFTGLEHLPSARLAWKASDNQLVWAAASRAVRAPARLDRDIRFPANPPFFILGGPDFVAEVAQVYELGYRAQPSSRWSYSATLFRHDWERLRSGQPAPAFVQNKIEGDTHGVEGWAAWQVTGDWRLSAGLVALREHLRRTSDSTDPTGASALGNDPGAQWSLRSTYSLPRRQELEVMLRHVGRLPNPEVPSYTAVDLSYLWRYTKALEFSATVLNLFDPGHAEWGAAPGRSEIGRGALLRVRWSY